MRYCFNSITVPNEVKHLTLSMQADFQMTLGKSSTLRKCWQNTLKAALCNSSILQLAFHYVRTLNQCVAEVLIAAVFLSEKCTVCCPGQYWVSSYTPSSAVIPFLFCVAWLSFIL